MDLGATNSGQPKHSAAAATDLRRTAPTWPDDHLMGPIWEIPPDRSSAEAVFAEAAAGSPAGAASYQFMDEDELASWLNCEIGEAGCGSVQGWMAEGFDAAPSAADSKGPTIKSGSKRKEAEVSMLGAMMRPSSPASAERKRTKACEAEAVQEHGCRRALQRKDPEVEYGERRKQARECGSVRKLRAMEIHKLSERKRRDKINAKMKALQELIPSCRKPDKASTLDEAIQYMKSLQLQVQMMSVQCNASPLLFPGMRPFFSPIGLGMQMGLGMDLGMTTGMEFAHGCPMLPFGQLPHPSIGGYRPAHFGPRTLPLLFPPAVPAANQVGDEAINLLNHLLDPRRSSDGVQIPPFSEPYRWFLGTACSQVQPQSEVFEESPINTSNASAGSHNRLEG